MYAAAVWLTVFCRDDLPYWRQRPREIPIEMCLWFAPGPKTVETVLDRLHKDLKLASEKRPEQRAGGEIVELVRKQVAWSELRLAHHRYLRPKEWAGQGRMRDYLDAMIEILDEPAVFRWLLQLKKKVTPRIAI